MHTCIHIHAIDVLNSGIVKKEIANTLHKWNIYITVGGIIEVILKAMYPHIQKKHKGNIQTYSDHYK